MKISPSGISLGGQHEPSITVDFDISNTGSREGAEVVQLYLGMPSTNAVPQPPKQLKGFQKVMLKPGKAVHVHLVLEARSLSYWDVKSHGWIVAPGTYQIMVGSSSRDIRLQGEVKVKK